jgi:hypothetical protein
MGDVTAKLSAGETFLIQGMENLIQREVVARLAHLTKRIEKQDVSIANMEKRLDKILQQIDHQNKGLWCCYVRSRRSRIDCQINNLDQSGSIWFKHD